MGARRTTEEVRRSCGCQKESRGTNEERGASQIQRRSRRPCCYRRRDGRRKAPVLVGLGVRGCRRSCRRSCNCWLAGSDRACRLVPPPRLSSQHRSHRRSLQSGYRSDTQNGRQRPRRSASCWRRQSSALPRRRRVGRRTSRVRRAQHCRRSDAEGNPASHLWMLTTPFSPLTPPARMRRLWPSRHFFCGLPTQGAWS